MASGITRLAAAAVQDREGKRKYGGKNCMNELEKGIKNSESVEAAYPVKAKRK